LAAEHSFSDVLLNGVLAGVGIVIGVFAKAMSVARRQGQQDSAIQELVEARHEHEERLRALERHQFTHEDAKEMESHLLKEMRREAELTRRMLLESLRGGKTN